MKPIATSSLMDEINAPKIVYKYRRWDNHLHRTILSTQTVFMAAPSSFEDELEFRNFKRYDLMNDEEIYAKYLQLSHEYNAQFTEEEHHAHAEEWTKRAPFKDVDYLQKKQQEQFKQYDERVGVLSLTEHNDSLKMWKYYAANGRGFCVGFNTKALFQYVGGGGQVLYPQEGLPIINGTDTFEVERWKQTFNKSLKWEFEKEYRVYIFKPEPLTLNERRLKLPSECYAEVVFGWNMPIREQYRVMKVCKAADLHPKFLQATKIGEVVSILPML